jgi:hypothetical protein
MLRVLSSPGFRPTVATEAISVNLHNHSKHSRLLTATRTWLRPNAAYRTQRARPQYHVLTKASYSQTDPSVRSVQLIGSWDNFSTWYTMQQDLRRGRGQWRGCYLFKDIISEDSSSHTSTRNGGLKMGNTYYYYVSHFHVMTHGTRQRPLSNINVPAVRGRWLYRNTRSLPTFHNSLPLHARPNSQHARDPRRTDFEAPKRFGQLAP